MIFARPSQEISYRSANSQKTTGDWPQIRIIAGLSCSGVSLLLLLIVLLALYPFAAGQAC